MNPNATNPVIMATIPETKFMVCSMLRRAGGVASLAGVTLGDSVNGVLLRPSKYLSVSPITNKQKRLANTPIPPDMIGAHSGGFPGHHHKIVFGPKANITGVTISETQALFCKRENNDRNFIVSLRGRVGRRGSTLRSQSGQSNSRKGKPRRGPDGAGRTIACLLD